MDYQIEIERRRQGLPSASRGTRPWRWRSWESDRQQLFEEAAEFVGPIDEMDLQDPVPGGAVGIGFADPLLIAVANREALRLGGRALVRKVAYQVSGAGAPNSQPASVASLQTKS